MSDEALNEAMRYASEWMTILLGMPRAVADEETGRPRMTQLIGLPRPAMHAFEAWLLLRHPEYMETAKEGGVEECIYHAWIESLLLPNVEDGR